METNAWDGIQTGFVLVGDGLTNLILHPLLSLQGMEHALDRWQVTQRMYAAEWGIYRQAAQLDHAVFVRSTLLVLTVLGLSVLTAQVLEKLSERVLRSGSHAISSLEKRLATHTPSEPGSVRKQAEILLRARNMLLEHRLGHRAFGVRRAFQRIRNATWDFAQAVRLSLTHPASFLLYALHQSGTHLVSASVALAGTLWRQFITLAVPLTVLFQPWISDAITMEATINTAHRQLAPVVKEYRVQVEMLSADEIDVRTQDVRQAYREYRESLLVLIEHENNRLDSEQSALDRLVGKNRIAGPVMDSRLDALFERWGRRNLYLTEEIVFQYADIPHSPEAPGRNWMVSYQDELELLRQALRRVDNDEKRAILTRNIDLLEREIAYAECVKAWDPGELFKQPSPETRGRCGSVNDSLSNRDPVFQLLSPSELIEWQLP